MKRFFIVLSMLFLVTLVSAEEATTDRFEIVVNSMVKAINEADYAGIQKDFGQVMLEAFPLEKSEPFFKNLSAQYGKIQKLDSAQLVSPEMAVFPAHFERGILDIKVVLDNQDKITGLWFLPHTGGEPAADTGTAADANTAGDANAIAEPNTTKAEWLEELENTLERINEDSERESRVWISPAENKRNLVRAVQRQVELELNFLRRCAVEEGAVKTTKAIDLLLASRQQRTDKIVKEIEEEKKRERLREREERRGRRRTREQQTRRSTQ